MIKILLLFCFICALLALGAVVVEEKGYVLISVADWTWESSLFGLVLLLLVVYFGILLIGLILRSVFNIRKNWRNWRTNKRQTHSLASLQQSLEALLNQQWQKAEKLSLKHAKQSPISSSHYLIAAEAARQLNQDDASAVYLLRAQQSGNETDKQLAICKSLMQEGKAEQAIEKCESIYTKEHKNVANLLLLARLYQTQQHPDKLREKLVPIRKYTDISDIEYRQLALFAYKPLFAKAVEDKNNKEIKQSFKQLSKQIKPAADSYSLYLAALIDAGFSQDAEEVVIKLFSEQIDKKSLQLLAKLELSQPLKLIAWLEKQIKKSADDVQLKIALAITASKNHDWRLAQQAMESAIHQAPETAENAENYALLGDIYQEQAQPDKAMICYRKGLHLSLASKYA